MRFCQGGQNWGTLDEDADVAASGVHRKSVQSRESNTWKENLFQATKTCGHESKHLHDVAPCSRLNGSKSTLSCLHCQLSSKPKPQKNRTH